MTTLHPTVRDFRKFGEDDIWFAEPAAGGQALTLDLADSVALADAVETLNEPEGLRLTVDDSVATADTIKADVSASFADTAALADNTIRDLTLPPGKVVLDGALTRLEDDINSGPNPWLRNSNVTGAYDQLKAGPRSIIRAGRTDYRMWWESLASGGATLTSYATSTNAVDWTKYGSNPIIPATEAWENNEVAPTCVLWDGTQFVLYFHGGNNPPGVRKIGRATSPDGLTWTKYAGNPILQGTAGTPDSAWVADAKVIRLSATNWIMFYRGTNDANVSQTFRATSTDGINWTKTSSTPVIAKGPAGAWDENGAYGTTVPYIDGGGRWHVWYAGEAIPFKNRIGYVYSDDEGVTFTKGVNNPVLDSNPEADSPDNGSVGDTLEFTNDGDKGFVSYGAEVFDSYTGAGGLPSRAICAAYLPLKRSGTPAKPGRFFSPGSHVALPSAVGLLNDLTATIVVRAKVYEDDEYRELYTEDGGAFNKQIFLRIGNTGLAEAWWRTPAGIASINSTARFDDNQWHTFAFRRNGTASFELVIDGTVIGSSTGNPGTITDTSTPVYGNWAPATGLLEPLLGTIGRIAVWDNAALSSADITAFVDNGTIPPAGQPRWWHDAGSGSPEPDKSPNGNNGTVTGTTIVNADPDAGLDDLSTARTLNVADTAALADNAAVVTSRDFADSVSLTDSATTQADSFRSFDDTITIADNTSSEAGLFPADLLTVADSSTRDFTKAPDDTVNLADSTTQEPGGTAVNRQHSAADSIDLADATIREVSFNLADSATLADEMTTGQVFSHNDTLALTDALSMSVELIRADSVAPTDQVFRDVETFHAETLTLADAAGKTVSIPLTSIIGVSDLASRIVAAARDDGLGLVDFAVQQVTVNVADVIPLADLLVTGGAATVELFLADALTLTDITVRSKAVTVTVSDAVSLSDVAVPSFPGLGPFKDPRGGRAARTVAGRPSTLRFGRR